MILVKRWEWNQQARETAAHYLPREAFIKMLFSVKKKTKLKKKNLASSSLTNMKVDVLLPDAHPKAQLASALLPCLPGVSRHRGALEAARPSKYPTLQTASLRQRLA